MQNLWFHSMKLQTIQPSKRLLPQYYILRRYCPPTSNMDFVNCPKEQLFTASISSLNIFLFEWPLLVTFAIQPRPWIAKRHEDFVTC